jgi:hypothetical protein
MVSKGVEDGRTELGSRNIPICEEVEGSAMLEGTLIGRLVDGGLSGVILGVLDVDGGSYEDVSTERPLEGRGGSVVGRGGGDEGRTVGTESEDGGTSGVEIRVGRGLSVVEGIGTGGELREGGGSLATVTGWGIWDDDGSRGAGEEEGEG